MVGPDSPRPNIVSCSIFNAAVKNDHTKLVNKKCTQQVRVTHSQLSLAQLLSGRVHMCAKAGFAANAMGDLTAGTHAFDMTRRADS